MPESQVLSAPVSSERPSTKIVVQPRPQGEFIMSGNLTRLDRTDTESVSEPVEQSAVMPNFLQREEVSIMIKKLRESVSFWKRIQSVSVESARDNVQSYALPQHHLYIK